MLQTFEADGAQGRQAQQQLGKPSKMKREEKKNHPSFLLKFLRFSLFLQYLFIVFPTCLAGRGISVSCMIPVMRKPFPLAPQPLVGLKDLWHLTTQSGQTLLRSIVTLTGDGCLWRWPTWVEEDDGPQTAELCLVHLHVFHLGHQLRQDSADMKVVLGANMETKRQSQQVILHVFATYLSKIEPTPALWALLRWTWRPVASRMPSFTVTERCEKEAMRSSFQPECNRKSQAAIQLIFRRFPWFYFRACV